MYYVATNFLFFGKDFPQVNVYVSPLAGLKIIIHPTQGFATLTLGFYVSALQAFCRFAAVDLVLLSANFLFFEKDFPQISTLCRLSEAQV